MSNYNSLKSTIDANVKQNGVQAITGQILNSVLNSMVNTLGTGYSFAGVATTATNPGSPDAKVFYIANGKGTYTNFGGISVTEDDVVVLYWDSSWHKVSTGIASQEKLSELQREAGELALLETTAKDSLVDAINEIANGGGGQGNPLEGLTVLAFGDSITALGGPDSTLPIGWTTQFLTKVQPKKFLNYAHSGATWSHTSSTKYNPNVSTGSIHPDNVIYNQIAKFLLDVAEQPSLAPDLIIIMAGTNDATANYRPYATSKSAAEEFENSNGYITDAELGTLTSIVSAMRYDIETLRTNFPGAQIVVMTPIESTTFTLAKIKDVGKCIYECAEYLGIDCIRLGDHCGIYREMENTTPTFLSDGIHPNENGAKMIGFYAATAIKGIVRSPVMAYVPPTPGEDYDVYDSLKTLQTWAGNVTANSISLGSIIKDSYSKIDYEFTTKNLNNMMLLGINASGVWRIWTTGGAPKIQLTISSASAGFTLHPLSQEFGRTRLIVENDADAGVNWSAKCADNDAYSGTYATPMGRSTSDVSVFPTYSSGYYNPMDRGTFHRLRIYNGSTLLYDFVPALRKSDNMKGIWDQVNDTFHFSESNQDLVELVD